LLWLIKYLNQTWSISSRFHRGLCAIKPIPLRLRGQQRQRQSVPKPTTNKREFRIKSNYTSRCTIRAIAATISDWDGDGKKLLVDVGDVAEGSRKGGIDDRKGRGERRGRGGRDNGKGWEGSADGGGDDGDLGIVRAGRGDEEVLREGGPGEETGGASEEGS